MASRPPGAKLHVDADGVRVVADAKVRRIVWLIVVAVGLPIVATIIAVAIIRLRPAADPAAPARAPTVGLFATAAAEPAASSREGTLGAAPEAKPPAAAAERVTPRRVAAAAHPSAPAAEKPKDAAQADVSAKELILALREAGERTGIAAFPPPGTEPIMRGIVVPEGFELPEGYVRHYQVTDEGERLPAILMVHPDYELVDAHGQPVLMPEHRIVPPEMAPPGLPIEMLEVPEAHAPGSPR